MSAKSAKTTKTRKRPGRPQTSHSTRVTHPSPSPRPGVQLAAHRADSGRAPGSQSQNQRESPTVADAQQRPAVRLANPRKPRPGRYQQLERQRRNSLIIKIAGGVLGAIAVLGVIYFLSNGGSLASGTTQQKQHNYDVANPAVGALAPDFNLPSTTGGSVRLGDLKGKNVLLYFQEGIGCEGCWTQLKDIESDMGRFQQLDISNVITITTNPLGALKQKVADETITFPVLSDESFAVSRAYNATMYGMMAGSADGHTFILVGPDGRIRWRADYGGPPDYTMYVPINTLIADIKAGANGK